MIPPTPGADPASRLFGWATPPDGAGPIGPDGLWPQKVDISFHDFIHALNPLHHVPGVGMIYRAVTGETIPMGMKIIGAGLFGGPMGVLTAALAGLVQELVRMGPDNSRPPTPVGMAECGTERPMDPVTPGTAPPGSYTTLATTLPEFLQPPPPPAGPARGLAAYATASQEWRNSQAFEKGLS